MSIDIKDFVNEIRNIMSIYSQYGMDPEYLEICNGSLKSWFQGNKINCVNMPNDRTIASAIKGKDTKTGREANGILIKAIITEDQISNIKGAIGFDKKTGKWDAIIAKKLLPLINTNRKFVQHLVLHEIAHHSGFSQAEEFECDKWAFEEMKKNGWLTH